MVSARAALLQVLYVGPPGYGIDLIARVKRLSNDAIVLHQGSVYPALRELERDGLVVKAFVQRDTKSGRPRRYYDITEEGRRVAYKNQHAILRLFHCPPPVPPRVAVP